MSPTSSEEEVVKSTVSAQHPDRDLFVVLISVMAIGFLAVVCSQSTTPWIGVPLGVLLAGALAIVGVRMGIASRDRWRDCLVVLNHDQDQATMRSAHSSAKACIASWPAVEDLVGLRSPEGMVARALWRIAPALKRREEVRTTQENLMSSVAGLPHNTEMRTDVESQLARTGSAAASIESEIQSVLSPLAALTAGTAALIRDAESFRKARQAVSNAERVLGAAAIGARQHDDSTELAGRIADVVNAY